jgi:hypothetical protein
MSKYFYEMGVNIQTNAISAEMARNQMRRSCEICSQRIVASTRECNDCDILKAHKIVMEAFQLQREIAAVNEIAKSAEEIRRIKRILEFAPRKYVRSGKYTKEAYAARHERSGGKVGRPKTKK